MTEKKLVTKNIDKNLIKIVLAFCGSISLMGIVAVKDAESISYTNSLFSMLIFMGGFYILNRIFDDFCRAGKRKHAYASFFSIFFAIAMQFGASMEANENVRMTNPYIWLRILAMTLFLVPIVNAVWDYLSEAFKRTKEDVKRETKLNFYQVWAIIFLLWIPTLMALYPGAFVYDAQDEYVEVISRSFTMHHPLLHVLLLGGIVHGAEYLGQTANTGIAIYILLQMAVVSAILAYSIKKLEDWGLKKKYLVLTMVYFGLFPIFPLYAVCTAKDTFFTAFFMLMLVLLVDYGKESFFTMKEMHLFVVASVLMMLFRNNGVYAYLVAIPVIYLFLRKKDRLKTNSDSSEKAVKNKGLSQAAKLVFLMLLSLVIFWGSNYILKTVTDASDSEHQEILTVPIQQIARVYTYSKDVFTDEDIETLYEVLPEEYMQTYRLRISDILKSGFKNDVYQANPAKYRSLWLRIGLKKPLIYLNAWFGTSYGYWYPDAINNVYAGNQMFTFQYKDSSYFGFETEPPGERDSKFKILELFYEKLSLELIVQKVPVVSMLFSPGFVFWILAFIFILILREKAKLLPLIPLILLWLTVLLGPTTIVRYVLILWFVLPLYPVLFYENRE